MSTSPVWIDRGLFASGTGAITVQPPNVYQDLDLFLLCVESANEAIVTPSGWTEVSNSPQGTGTPGAAGSVRLSVYYKEVSGVQSNIVIPDSGNHTTAVIHCFRGVNLVNPINITSGSVDSVATSNIISPSIITTVDNCLIANCIGLDLDANNTTTAVSSVNLVNVDLTNLTLQFQQTSNSATGGGSALITGSLSSAGNSGATSTTGSTATTHAYITLALEPLPDLSATVNLTETGDDTASATGAVIPFTPITGDINLTDVLTDTASITGQVIIQGNGTLYPVGDDTISAPGQVFIKGLIAAFETEQDIASITGQVIIQGDAASICLDDIFVITGKVFINGTANVTETTFDAVFSEGINVIFASIVLTENFYDTANIAGDVLIQGDSNKTEIGTDSLSISGKILVKGTIPAIETGIDFVTSDGKLITTGNLNLIEVGSDTAELTGKIITKVFVDLIDLVNETISSSGEVIISGSLGLLEVNDVLEVTGHVIVQGDSNETETLFDEASAEGLVSTNVYFDLVETHDNVSAVGKVYIAGLIDASEPSDIYSIIAKLLIQGDINPSEDLIDDLLAIGGPYIQGDGNLSESGIDLVNLIGKVIIKTTISLTEELLPDTASSNGLVLIKAVIVLVETGADDSNCLHYVEEGYVEDGYFIEEVFGGVLIQGSYVLTDNLVDSSSAIGLVYDNPLIEYLKLVDNKVILPRRKSAVKFYRRYDSITLKHRNRKILIVN